MAEKLRIFVSATSDLEQARAAIGRAVAELPVEIGVEIRRTPQAGASYDDIFEAIANVDRVYFLMGRDITAPAGAEWHLAWKLERSVLPLRSAQGRSAHNRTLAAQEFMRNAFIEWMPFASTAQLARIVTLDLARLLHHPANRYGLTVNEIDLLNVYIKRIGQLAVDAGPEASGAEGGGILLDASQRETEEDLILG
ncbi:MAG: hypothetical protein WDZ49_03530 [Litorilinea sp.]